MRIGVDLGGTKIEIVVLDDEGVARLRRRIPTPRDDYLGTVMAIAGLVEDVEDELGQRGSVGIGIPGAESRETGLIKNANSIWLIGKPFRRDLQAVLQREVRLENDANCLALSEAVDGAAAGAASVFGVILGTGVGGGIVIDGKPLHGANAIAGEWGHNPLPLPGPDDYPLPACYCGRSGCIETYLSGPGLAQDHAKRTREMLTAETIATRAAKGDTAARFTLACHATRLARSLASVINLLDPEVIVLGGGLSNLPGLYTAVPALWGAHVFSDTVRTRLVPARFGDSSGVRGAAWLWNE